MELAYLGFPTKKMKKLRQNNISFLKSQHHSAGVNGKLNGCLNDVKVALAGKDWQSVLEMHFLKIHVYRGCVYLGPSSGNI